MGITKKEDVIAWETDKGEIICTACGDPGEAKPLTKGDFEETDIVTCDDCDGRIQ